MIYLSQFDQNASVLSFGFTDRDATPPDYFKRKPKSEKPVEQPKQPIIVDGEEIPEF